MSKRAPKAEARPWRRADPAVEAVEREEQRRAGERPPGGRAGEQRRLDGEGGEDGGAAGAHEGDAVGEAEARRAGGSAARRSSTTAATSAEERRARRRPAAPSKGSAASAAGDARRRPRRAPAARRGAGRRAAGAGADVGHRRGAAAGLAGRRLLLEWRGSADAAREERSMGYGTVSRLFHWVTVLLVLVMIPVGLIMTQEIPRPLQDPLFILHKGLGPVVLVVVLLRLAWRAFHPPPPLPASVPPLQARLAELVHAGLYFFLIVQAVSGYVRVTTGGFPIEALKALGIPPLLPKAEGVARAASTVHAVGAAADRADRDARRGGGLSRARPARRGLLADVAADRAKGGQAAVALSFFAKGRAICH